MKLCNFDVGLNHPLFLIAGPCVIESQRHHDFALLRRKFERVGKEVNQYL